MKQYTVTLPVAGSVQVYVEAENEKAAIDAALESADFRVNGGKNTEPGEEWAVLRRITSGNVCHAPVWEAEASEDL